MKKYIRFFLYLATITPIIIFPKIPFPFISSKVLYFRMLMLAIILPTLYAEYKRRRDGEMSQVSHLPLFLFMAVTLFCNLAGVLPQHSMWSNWQRYNGYIELLYFCVMYLAMVNTMRNRHWLLLTKISLTVSSIICLDALHYALANGIGSVYSTIGNSIYMGAYLMIHFFLSLHLCVKRRSKFLISIAALHIVGICLANSRGVYIGTFAGLLFLSVFHSTKRRVVVTIACLTLVTICLMMFHPRFAPAILFNDSRIIFWQVAIDGFLERPLMGWGMENFGAAYRAIGEKRLAFLTVFPDKPHNMFLEWLVAAGPLGLSMYLLLLGGAASSLYRNKHYVLLAGFFAYLVHLFFLFDILVTYLYFFSLLAYTQTSSEKS